jgi:hypothetical protein
MQRTLARAEAREACPVKTYDAPYPFGPRARLVHRNQKRGLLNKYTGLAIHIPQGRSVPEMSAADVSRLC